MSVEKKVQVFSCKLKKFPKNMRIFSLCFRSLYVENAVAASAYNAAGINTIRDQTRQDAIVFMKGVLPLSIQVVRYAQEFFEYYEGLELDEWKEYLPAILKEVTEYQQFCIEVVRMQEEMTVSLKKREDKAKLLLPGLKDENKKLDEKKAQLEQEADNSEAWANVLFYIPVVNVVAYPLLRMDADENRAQAEAKGTQVNINEAAITILTGVLLKALSKFIDGLENLSGFFSVMKQELTTILDRVNQTEPVKLHLIMMKKKALEVKQSCRDFHTMVPGVRTDLQCIPYKPVDLNYFDEWLIKQQAVIKRNKNQTLTAKLVTLLRQCESIDGFQQLAINN